MDQLTEEQRKQVLNFLITLNGVGVCIGFYMLHKIGKIYKEAKPIRDKARVWDAALNNLKRKLDAGEYVTLSDLAKDLEFFNITVFGGNNDAENT